MSDKLSVAADSAASFEARFHRLLEATSDAIVLTDQDGRVVLVNAPAERLFGYAPGEIT
ncbi:MAG TPA: PAS domain-containing protein, partial [Polyangia bacterium]